MSLAITVVVDNAAPPHLASEHGFAAWIETPDRTILFDTGQGGALPRNIVALGLPSARAEALVLSHGHYDHTGGLPFALRAAPDAIVYAHPAVRRPRYAVREGPARSIGIPPAALEALERLPAARRPPVDRPIELAPGVGLTGPIPREVPGEDAGGPFFLDPERVVPCHCTGERAVERLARTLGPRVVPGAAGTTFRFD
jgi:7,8-dihydropterin-6-yl-methyl-4-(beta-D-ribofuranosyl)aminobenzene 5'-phosphate synthase